MGVSAVAELGALLSDLVLCLWLRVGCSVAAGKVVGALESSRERLEGLGGGSGCGVGLVELLLLAALRLVSIAGLKCYLVLHRHLSQSV